MPPSSDKVIKFGIVLPITSRRCTEDNTIETASNVGSEVMDATPGSVPDDWATSCWRNMTDALGKLAESLQPCSCYANDSRRASATANSDNNLSGESSACSTGETVSASIQLVAQAFVGIDKDDRLLSNSDAVSQICQCFASQKVEVDVHHPFFEYPPGSICRIWNDLAKHAFLKHNCDFVVLLGDDVTIQPNWMLEVYAAFARLQMRICCAPFGFGCVCIPDDTFPGFPTFPVLHRVHFDAFGGSSLFPTEHFYNQVTQNEQTKKTLFFFFFSHITLHENQDADPFLFAVYQRLGAAVFASNTALCNTIGGPRPARYLKVAYPEWRSPAFLDSYVRRLETWLSHHYQQSHSITADHPNGDSLDVLGIQRKIMLDVVVPTYRCTESILAGIVSLQVPHYCETTFIIIVDNPAHELAKQDGGLLTSKLLPSLTTPGKEFWYRLKVRVQPCNSGAPAARNRGLRESSADCVLFLDDDVVPNRDVLMRYCEAIQQHSRTSTSAGCKAVVGFIGRTVFPDQPKLQYCNAVNLSIVNYFYDIAARMEEPPWGVTANLLVRRDGETFFDTDFVKTGGGEDIDYCIKLRKNWQARHCRGGDAVFKSAPQVIVTHPWWDNASRSYSQFYRWGRSDGQLIDKHPELTYRAPPGLWETIIGTWTFHLFALLFMGHASWNWFFQRAVVTTIVLWIADVAVDVWLLMLFETWCTPKVKGIRRVFGAIEGNIVKNSIEWGHVWGHIRRGTFLFKNWNICRRFDWHCGSAPSVVPQEI